MFEWYEKVTNLPFESWNGECLMVFLSAEIDPGIKFGIWTGRAKLLCFIEKGGIWRAILPPVSKLFHAYGSVCEERHGSEEVETEPAGSLRNNKRHLLSAYFVQDMGAERLKIYHHHLIFRRALWAVYYLLSADKETERGLKGFHFCTKFVGLRLNLIYCNTSFSKKHCLFVLWTTHSFLLQK